MSRYFTFLLLIAFFIIDAKTVEACSCGAEPTVLEAFEDAQNVVIAKVFAVEKSTARFTIERVFKGKLKVDEEMILLSVDSGCSRSFSVNDIGKSILFYKNDSDWIGICGRTRGLKYAADDLLYLENLSKVRGKTRISGKISFSQDSPLEDGESIYKVLDGVKVKIIGRNKTFETKTDKNGIYEIYGLPAGTYTIKPEIPKTMKINDIYSSSSSVDNEDEDEEDLRKSKAQIVLKSKKHAYFDFALRVNNAVRGTVIDPQGQAMNGVCLNLIPAEGKVSRYFNKVDCTERDGKFEIDEIPFGNYLVVANDDGKISSREPFRTLFYPGVFEREKAAVITIGDGVIWENADIQVPEIIDLVTIEGRFLYSDGKPVIDESVSFKAERSENEVDGDAGTKTNSQGYFSIKILKGLKGRLFGSMYTYLGEFENCPMLDKVIRENGKEPKTAEIEIEAAGNLKEVEIKFPFPYCKKAK